MTGYYDYVLGLIPATLIGISASLSLVGLPLTMAVAAGASVAIGLMGHAMFVNGPVSGGSAPTASTQTAPTNAD